MKVLKLFKQLRIFVNKEYPELIQGIIKATQILKPGGKLIVVSFHSIEDKIVKYSFKNFSRNSSKRSNKYLPENLKNLAFLIIIKIKFLEHLQVKLRETQDLDRLNYV